MKDIEIQGQVVKKGERKLLRLKVGVLTTHEPVTMRVWVIRGKKDGPTLMVSGCLHGDEINGAEVIRRLVNSPTLRRGLKGTLIAVPIVNVPAYSNRSRYLPDRRDLNRLFPGSPKGSLGGRLAHVLTTELLPHCDAVVDLHTGAINRPNLPQIRVTAEDEPALELATAFGSPVTLLSPVRGGTFRSACNEAKVPVILYESGEALRLDTASIRFGKRGVLTVMRHIGMLPKRAAAAKKRAANAVVCEKSYWERAQIGGLFTPLIALGKAVKEGDVLGFVADPLGDYEEEIKASYGGILIGRTNEGQADEGDALFHIAQVKYPNRAEQKIVRSGEGLPDIAAKDDDHPVHYDPYTDVM
ncbi:succinylglutamate desuccinylase/aspartoacylase family protein [Verrucomicrobiaceae bacterium R5-34]|uniref:Succinylglutamate desuccinylase/aspartoacylase family protein n=1 Tax=Oceaniferula flava TaxID=2800421 RepID=A0AAE2SCE1_9BACT|nr:succinylglutamate desuccinylase/aspartoacylase family protein [Oceaniferula flavus]MBK1830206.1 succinylglutamate desuccinylase/aspartoacylase family protein [Verrucomicrobiaceae bacterium R5-34]MBK1854797.1 succinylglutamate desuccinylase/aspartoacylase family protein [Oceaniferula flavus]MBM1136103.1 succinylglutamate desuccinylase/aspartoacylase family protein [Oceaniferula flavus]